MAAVLNPVRVRERKQNGPDNNDVPYRAVLFKQMWRRIQIVTMSGTGC